VKRDRVRRRRYNEDMGLLILSAVGLPFLAVVFFSFLQAAFSKLGLWAIVSHAGFDLCKVSIGIVGAMFLDIQIRAAGTVAAAILVLEFIISIIAMVIEKRAKEMGIERESSRAFSILGCGIISMVIPAVMIVLSGGD